MTLYAPKLTMICDDDRPFRERLARAFNQKGVKTCLASNAAEAIQVFKAQKPDSAIIDLKMPKESGLALLQRLKEIDVAVRAVILTGYGSIASAVDAVRLGAHNYLTKPTSFQNIYVTLCGEQSLCDDKVTTPSLEEVEREYIQRVLDEKDGNISHAAKTLGLHRRSLQRKLYKFGS